MIIRRKKPEYKCGACGFYSAFYIKKDTCFEKLNDGYCKECKQIKDKNETCGKWKTKYERALKKFSCIPVFRDLAVHLTAMKQILQEEKDERDRS